MTRDQSTFMASPLLCLLRTSHEPNPFNSINESYPNQLNFRDQGRNDTTALFLFVFDFQVRIWYYDHQITQFDLMHSTKVWFTGSSRSLAFLARAHFPAASTWELYRTDWDLYRTEPISVCHFYISASGVLARLPACFRPRASVRSNIWISQPPLHFLHVCFFCFRLCSFRFSSWTTSWMGVTILGHFVCKAFVWGWVYQKRLVGRRNGIINGLTRI